MFSPHSTIVAIATPPGRGGIGVIRISGTEARAVAERMLVRGHSGNVLPESSSRHAGGRGCSPGGAGGPEGPASTEHLDSRVRGNDASHAGGRGFSPGGATGPEGPASTEHLEFHVRGSDASGPRSPVPVLVARHATHCLVLGQDGSPVDEVVATLFAAPHSYTGEDVVEIAAHGSPALLRAILDTAMRAGARLAEPGEFTFRAFLNGRLDLPQAEAVNDLVEAVTPLQARVAFDQLQGTLTDAIGALDRELFDLVVRLEASLDFPDEGYHFADRGEVHRTVSRVRDGVAALLATSRLGRVVREGRQIAILGKPNVGKSTLFNRLVGSERAIVTDIPGTTRDLVTETVDFEGIRLNIVDTAGIRAGADVIEAEGIARARRAAAVADVVVLVFDQSRPLEAWDFELLEETASSQRVVAVNKTDLAPAWPASELVPDPRSLAPGESPCLPVSLKSGAGWDAFRSALLRALDAGEPLRDTPLVTNLRHQTLLEQALAALEKVEKVTLSFSAPAPAEKESVTFSGVSEEFLLADLAAARAAFEEITGKRTTEDILRAIFSRFCIGK